LVVLGWLFLLVVNNADGFDHALVRPEQAVEVTSVKVKQLFDVLVIYQRLVGVALAKSLGEFEEERVEACRERHVELE
jgi:hypothetical protein